MCDRWCNQPLMYFDFRLQLVNMSFEVVLGSLSNIIIFWFGLGSIEATSKQGGYSPLELKFLNNTFNCSHRNIGLFGVGLWASTFNVTVCNFLPDLLKQLAPF